MSPLAGGRDGAVFRLDEAVADVFGDLRLAPVLRRLLAQTRRLTGSVAGSVSLVDAEHGRYVKVAEYGDFCHLGDTFPLDEGATGRAFDRRRPVVIPDYGRMRTNHLGGRHPGRRGPAAAVPIWWRGDVIAVNVAFTGQGGQFSSREVEDLEALTQTAAAAIIQSGRHGPSPAGEIRRRFTTHNTVVTEVGVVRPVSAELARVAADLVTAAARSRPHPRLHVAVVYRPHGLRVLVQDENAGGPAAGPDPLGMGTTTWDELLRLAGGGVTVEEVRGWGVLVRADLPYSIGAGPEAEPAPYSIGAGPGAEPAPFTPREAEVLDLLRQGLTDRKIAARLVLSAKTVEKHVGAIMRKTKTTNRTAAVMAALEHDW